MHIIPEKRAIILTLRNPERVATLFPHHQRLDHNTVAIRHGVEEVRVLKNLDIEAPSPISTHYSWPGRYTPFRHQRDTSAFFTLNSRCFCFNDMGLGKSLSALWAADFLQNEGILNRVLILTTMSCMEPVWQHEIFTNFMHRTSMVVHGSAARRKLMIGEDVDFYIMNHEGLRVPGIVEALLERNDIDLIVVDEASMMRNSRTKTYAMFKKLLKPNHWLWMLTGQPCPNGPEDAFGLGQLVAPKRLPQYFTRWQAETMVKVNQFKWVPKPDAMKKVHEALQPAIRFNKDECLDLPPVVYLNRNAELSSEQVKAYRTMKEHLRITQAGEPITAVNAAVKLSKLLQICCIAYDTPVLSSRGWIPIQEITSQDKLWDGVEWVTHAGVIYKGRQSTINCGGVFMTPEHEILMNHGWISAKDFINANARNKFDWPEIRLPDSYTTRWNYQWQNKKSVMALSLYLWQASNTRKPKFAFETSTQSTTLWLSPRRTYKNSRYVKNSSLSHMDKYATTLFGPQRQGLEKLWWSWNNCLPTLAGFIRIILERHACRLFKAINSWSPQQQRQLHTEELSMGDIGSTKSKQKNKFNNPNSTWTNDNIRSSQSLWNSARDFIYSNKKTALASEESIDATNSITSKVYDIVNCGPRQRFVVRGVNGELRIVHNCGAVHTDVDSYAALDMQPRLHVLKEIVDEANAKVIVFVPYTGAIRQVRDFLDTEGYESVLVDGHVTGRKRVDSLNAFTRNKECRILLANPETAAHGLNLAVADTMIWMAPIHSLETYRQACERMARPDQVNHMRIVHVGSTTLEWKVYATLQNKDNQQQSLLELYKQEMQHDSL